MPSSAPSSTSASRPSRNAGYRSSAASRNSSPTFSRAPTSRPRIAVRRSGTECSPTCVLIGRSSGLTPGIARADFREPASTGRRVRSPRGDRARCRGRYRHGRLAWYQNGAAAAWTRHDFSRRQRGMFDKFVARDMDGDVTWTLPRRAVTAVLMTACSGSSRCAAPSCGVRSRRLAPRKVRKCRCPDAVDQPVAAVEV
jgi:hypothetical protein